MEKDMELNGSSPIVRTVYYFSEGNEKTTNPFSQHSHSSGKGKTKHYIKHNIIDYGVNIHSSMQCI
jgi:hypothetical protein